MEKYGQTDNSIVDGLRIEESQLMGQMAKLLCVGEKTASEVRELSQIETRLQHVRAKITEIDLTGK